MTLEFMAHGTEKERRNGGTGRVEGAVTIKARQGPQVGLLLLLIHALAPSITMIRHLAHNG
jgi:hypothetical protein